MEWVVILAMHLKERVLIWGLLYNGVFDLGLSFGGDLVWSYWYCKGSRARRNETGRDGRDMDDKEYYKTDKVVRNDKT